jgi:hypothetical protein
MLSEVYKRRLQELSGEVLSEKLASVDDDVEMLYAKYFEKDIKELERTGVITDEMFLPAETNTAMLRSPEAVEANNLNMCIININSGSNFYFPDRKMISISINVNAIDYVKQHDGNLKRAIDYLDDEMHIRNLSVDFTEERVKGTIHHELAHWIDDTMHNSHIKNSLRKARESGQKQLFSIPVNASKMEIHAQMHNIKQLHNKYSSSWDTLSFMDMINLSPPLIIVHSQLPDSVKKTWIRDLKTRMHREGLLGKNMVNSAISESVEDNIKYMIASSPQIIKVIDVENNVENSLNEARKLVRGLIGELLDEHWACLNEEFDPFSHLEADSEEDIDPDEDCLLTISQPNSKLGQIQAPSLSLPAGYSCPFAKVCKSLAHRHGKKAFGGKAIKDYGDVRCYAASAEVSYPTVRRMRWRNYDLLMSVGKKGGAQAMADLLVRSLRHYEQNNGAIRVFRIHDSGDFFSPDYLDAWIECAKAMPGVLFYAYTKSLSFWANRKSEIPKNLRLIASEGGKEDELIGKEGFRRSVIVKDSGEAIQRNLNIDVNDFLAAFGDKDFALLLHGVQSAESGQTRQSFANSKIIKNAASKFHTSPEKIEKLIKLYID